MMNMMNPNQNPLASMLAGGMAQSQFNPMAMMGLGGGMMGSGMPQVPPMPMDLASLTPAQIEQLLMMLQGQGMMGPSAGAAAQPQDLVGMAPGSAGMRQTSY